ncbi:kinesin-like protein KIF20A isoform X2 [Copidosoma floridanum]|uniref:kinesin-like protein KIF20A isoform X2 n=1 Tax=Copidosoma floridanum TaxID=29053 RepID=UPI000C6F5365|nr:kinesin-like protein KIF20A isoform X2 [Copidosoma floridanum]
MSDTSYGFGVINKMSIISGSISSDNESVRNEISSSDNESVRNDVSYLYARDPSILAYGQRPLPPVASKKNLYSLLEEKEDDKEEPSQSRDTISTVLTTTVDPSTSQTIKVFLRMKPLPKKMKLTQEQIDAYQILNSTTLMTSMQSLDNNTSCLKKVKASEMVCRKFIFTQTFDAMTSQLELFENAVKPQMIDFLSGKNSIVMTYGTTNSGKTYTLQGTPESPGIIPRGIEFLFSHINPRGTPCFKPVNLCDIVYLNSQERAQEIDAKMKLLALNPGDKNMYISTYNQMQQRLVQESPMRPNRNFDAQYSVWISFAEIYNETIYDLLWNDCHKRRPALKLATDACGRTFIRGLKSVCVSSGADAYQVLMAGQYNLKVAATALNSRSSRSHCIFTIKLLKYRKELDPNSVDVSMFAFCDLAGSERLKKTLNVGERLKEAQNINTSLLVLGRCLKTIYESQNSKQKNESIGPFRESKLTRLFQRALSGKEQIALIVNVNPVPNLYIETQNVLNFSAIAKKIVVQRTNIVKRRHSQSRFSRLVTQSIKTDMDWENTELDDETEPPETEVESDIDENDEEAYEELLTENEILKKENKELKQSILTKEMQTRQELTDVYTEIMKKLEADWKNRLSDMEEQQEDLRELAVEQIELYYKEKLKKLNSRKRSRSSMMEDDEDDDKYIEDLEAENTKLTAKVETLKKTIRDLKQVKDVTETEKTKMAFELAVAKEEAKCAGDKLKMAQESICSEDAPTEYINKLLEESALKDERIKKMKIFLNEAKEEYIEISSHAHKMEVRVKQLEDDLTESTEQIRDLEEQLIQANAYSSKQSKAIEDMEEELEQQVKKVALAEEKARKSHQELLAVSSSDDKVDDESKDQSNSAEKALLEELRLKLELVEKENSQLQQKLDAKCDEIESLKSNLDVTKSQLDKVTEKVSNLSIDESKQKKCFTVDQKWQTDESSIEEKFELVDVSLQTIGTETSIVKTDEKCLQTSVYLNDTEAYAELEKQFDEMKLELDTCKAEKLQVQSSFEEELKDLNSKVSQLKAQMDEKNEKILEMQAELCLVLQNSKKESDNFKELMLAQEAKCKELSVKLEELQKKEADKDVEINTLQKEMKNLIRSNEETVFKMEGEMKSALLQYTNAQEELKSEGERRKKVRKDYEDVIHVLEKRIDELEETSLNKQAETEKLEKVVEELKKALSESDRQLEVFEKNQIKTLSQYDDVIASRNEELSQLKAENKKFQDLLQLVKENTENVDVLKSTRKPRRKPVKSTADENTSEDDHTESIRSCKSTKKKPLFTPKAEKPLLTPKVENISTVDLCSSESKRNDDAQDFAAPARVTRRRKLFMPQDDSFIDLEGEQCDPSSPPSARSLRNRKK